MTSTKTGKVIISIAVILSAGVSTLVDLLPGEAGHVHNATWPAHAVFHDIVMFLFLDFMAIVSLWLLWRKSPDSQVGPMVATLMVVGFWSPFYYITSLFKEASLAAANAGTPQYAAELKAVTIGNIAGLPVYINVCIGTAMIVIALIGYILNNKNRQT